MNKNAYKLWIASIIACFSLLFFSCASERKVSKKQIRRDAWGRKVNYTVGKDEQGNPVMQSSLRSSFEKKRAFYHKKQAMWQASRYQTDYLDTKTWSGQKTFAGNKSFSKKSYRERGISPTILQQARQDLAYGARQDRQSYATSSYKTAGAQESRKDPLPYKEDASTALRRKRFITPPIVDWKDQQDLNVEQANALIGR